MASIKQLKQEQRLSVQQRQVVADLETLVNDLERCEQTITHLKTELEGVNVKHQGRQTTRDDIAYLQDLLRCANKKLAWEKQMMSLQKRTPEVMERMSKIVNDPMTPADSETRGAMLDALQRVQTAMERLQEAQVK